MCYNGDWNISRRRVSINSMTGYGRCQRERDGRRLTIELKSVNHRFLDLAVRMPRTFAFAEDEVRKAVGARLTRGHVEAYFTYQNTREDARTVEIDVPLVAAYLRAMDGLTGLQDDRTLMGVLRLPEVVRVEEAREDQQQLRALVLETLAGALEELCQMRAREGEALKGDLAALADALEAVVERIRERYAQTAQAYMQRLRAAVEELAGTPIDPSRLAQEVAIMADRAAIDEELVRLDSHISQLRLLLTQGEPDGRRLDFLAQELNREGNTISSKSQDIEITRLAMEAKALIEKVREQVQNVE